MSEVCATLKRVGWEMTDMTASPKSDAVRLPSVPTLEQVWDYWVILATANALAVVEQSYDAARQCARDVVYPNLES